MGCEGSRKGSKGMTLNRRGLFKTLVRAVAAPFVAKALPVKLNWEPPTSTLDEMNRITLEYLKDNPIADTVFSCGSGTLGTLYWSTFRNGGVGKAINPT